MNSRQKIILTPSDFSLVNKINEGCEHCHVLLDTTAGSFSVTLPDAQGTNQRELIFKNIGTHNATINSAKSQFIDLSTSHVLRPLDLISVWPDLVRTWWRLDSNSGTTEDVTISGTTLHFVAGVYVGHS